MYAVEYPLSVFFELHYGIKDSFQSNFCQALFDQASSLGSVLGPHCTILVGILLDQFLKSPHHWYLIKFLIPYPYSLVTPACLWQEYYHISLARFSLPLIFSLGNFPPTAPTPLLGYATPLVLVVLEIKHSSTLRSLFPFLIFLE